MALSNQDYRGMLKADIEGLTKKINKNHIGPNMSVSLDCANKKCNREFTFMIDWRYETFFVASSR
jgi:hypothetical protein